MFRRLTAIGSGVAAVAAISGMAFVPSARAAVPKTLGPGWTAAVWQAGSGGGCASPDSDELLSPIASYPCSYWTWYYRVLGQLSDGREEVEFVDSTGTYAVGYSGNEFKLETPNSNPGGSFVLFGSGSECSDNFCLVANSAGTEFGKPNGEGLPLKISTTGTPPQDGWQY